MLSLLPAAGPRIRRAFPECVLAGKGGTLGPSRFRCCVWRRTCVAPALAAVTKSNSQQAAIATPAGVPPGVRTVWHQLDSEPEVLHEQTLIVVDPCTFVIAPGLLVGCRILVPRADDGAEPGDSQRLAQCRDDGCGRHIHMYC